MSGPHDARLGALGGRRGVTRHVLIQQLIVSDVARMTGVQDASSQDDIVGIGLPGAGRGTASGGILVWGRRGGTRGASSLLDFLFAMDVVALAFTGSNTRHDGDVRT